MLNNFEVIEERYDKEFINRLSKEKCSNIKIGNIYYGGIPLNILALSYYLCRKNCHFIAIQLSRVLDEFNLVTGNVRGMNYTKDGNHSWIETRDWVIDQTCGSKYKIPYYYAIFDPKVVSVINQDTYFMNNIYMYYLTRNDKYDIDERTNLELIFKLLEYLEKLKPTPNGKKLFEEIEKYKIKNPYNDKLSNETIKKYIYNAAPQCLQGIKY